MTTVRQQIRDRIIFELNETPVEGVPEATKRRWVPGRKLDGRQLAVFFGPNETVEARLRGFPVDDRTLIVSIQAASCVEDPVDADDEIEPMLQHVVGILGDTSLNKLATQVTELGTEWASAQADLFYHAALIRYAVRYQTRHGDLTLKQ